jgi:hypothetical protein
MSEELKNIEKDFILDEDMEHRNLKSLVTRTMKLCKTDKVGTVIIDANILLDMIIPQRIMCVLTARRLANQLQGKVGSEVTIMEDVGYKELACMIHENPAVVAARLKELKDKKQVLQISRGIYRIAPYAIESFLKQMEDEKND